MRQLEVIGQPSPAPRRLLALAAILCGFLLGAVRTTSGQESKGTSETSTTGPKRWQILCGSQGMLTDVTQIPSIGCFRLSVGQSAVGDFAGHRLTVSVDSQGEACRVDGAPFNCSGCIDGSRDGCPAMLEVHSREQNGVVNFVVSRKFAERSYVTNQENLDFEQKRLQSGTRAPARTPGSGIAGTPVPKGPYSSWPEESRKKAIVALSFRCVLASGMQFANYQGSKEAGKEMMQAMSMACIDHQMPDDWPGHANVQTSEREHLEKAKHLDPSFSSLSPDDVWREIAKKMKADDTASTGGKP